MSTLYTFGCSYTAEYKDNQSIPDYVEYKKYKGNLFPPTWVEVLSNKLEIPFVNLGVGGKGNNFIFQMLCKNINKIKKGDIVIIQWTYIHRYMWVKYEKNAWGHLGAGPLNGDDIITESTHEEICYNRTHSLYVEQIYEWMNMIDVLSKSIGFDVYYWSGDCKIISPIELTNRLDKKYLMSKFITQTHQTPFDRVFELGGETIKKETNGLINDLHFGESAHKILGELFYEHITNF
jgi:hypothetical protein